MSNKENIEDIFRKRFENMESPVSGRVWENIKNTLPPKKRGPGRFILLSAVTLFIIGTVGTYLYLSEKNSIKGEGNNTAHREINSQNNLNNDKLESLTDSDIEKENKNFLSLSEKQDKNKKKANLKTKHSKFEENNDAEINKGKDIYSEENNKEGSRKDNRKNQTKNRSGYHESDRSVYNNPVNEMISLADGNEFKSEKKKSERKNGGNQETRIEGDPVKKASNKVNGKPHAGEKEGEFNFEENLFDNSNSNKKISTPKDEKENIHDDRNKINKNGELVSTGINTEKEIDSIDSKIKNTLLATPLTEKEISGEVKEDSALANEEEIPKDSAIAEDKEEEKKEKKEKMKRWSLDLFAGPSVTYRSLNGNSYIVDNRDQFEKPGLNTSAGVRVNFGITEKFSLNAGLGMAFFGEKYDYMKEHKYYEKQIVYDTVWVDSSLNKYYYVTKDTITLERKKKSEYSKRNYYRYMEIPFSATYVFSTGRLSFGITGGISLNVLLRAYTGRMEDSILLTMESGKGSPFRPVTFGAFLNPVIIYKISNNWAVFTEPGVKLLLTSVYRKEEEISLRPYGLNVNVGVRYMIGSAFLFNKKRQTE